MNCAQILRKANDLKAEISDGQGDPWVTRQSLQELYQQILLGDLEYALDKKVEQDLWNHVFKNQISALQRKAKDKTNPKRNEVQAMLTFILDSASGFYLQLLQELCSAFTLDIPCRVRTSQLGMGMEKNNNVYNKVVIPQHSSCLYICQHCLVHLGDLARYRNETSQAESYYLHAANLVPTNGQPYNQLAIVAASKGDQLAMTFYYIRSIAVKHPFPAAATNLQTTFAKLVDRDEVKLFKMKEVELIHFFIKFHAIIYLAMGEQDLQIASAIKDKLEENFRSHLAQDTLTSRQLVQISAINLFALSSIRQDPGGSSTGGKKIMEVGGGGEVVQDGGYSADEKLSWSLTLGMTLTLLQLMLNYMPTKSDDIALMWPGLAATKVLLDWMIRQPAIFSDPVLSTKTMIWGKLARVLNTIQPEEPSNKLPSYKPLPEDTSLRGFQPMNEAHSTIKFSLTKKQKLTDDEEMAERASQLVAHGRMLVDNYPSLMKMELADDTGRITFTSPAGDDNTKRPHHQKQKQQQQRSKPEFIKSVTIVDPVKESGHGIAISTSKSGSHGKVASRSSGPSPTMLQSGGNVRGIVKKGRERRDSEGMMHGERERGKGAGRKSAESRKASDGDSKTQSIAVQAILPRQKPSLETSNAKKARQPSPNADLQQQMSSPPVLHDQQNRMQQSSPQNIPSYHGYGGGGPQHHHHPSGPPPPMQHPWQGQGPGPGPPPPYPPPPGGPMHGPPPPHPPPPGPYPPYMPPPQVPPPNFPRGPPPHLHQPPHQRPPPQSAPQQAGGGDVPWQHKPTEPGPPPHQQMPPHPSRDGQGYDSFSNMPPPPSQMDSDGWPQHLPAPPTTSSEQQQQQRRTMWGGSGRMEQDQGKLPPPRPDMYPQQQQGSNQPEQHYQGPVRKPGQDYTSPPPHHPVPQQQSQQVPPPPPSHGQYPQHPPPPFGNQAPPPPHQGKSASNLAQQQPQDVATENLLELLVKLQSQPPQQQQNNINFTNGLNMDTSSLFPERSLSSQEKALTALAVGLGLQNPTDSRSSPTQAAFSQYESLMNSMPSASRANPQQSFNKNHPATSNQPMASDSPFSTSSPQHHQSSYSGGNNTMDQSKQAFGPPHSSSSQHRLPPGLHGLEGDLPQQRRMNSSPFENSSTSLFSPPQQQKPLEPTPGAPADWRSNEPMLGMTSGSSSQGSRSQLFPTMPHDEQARDRQRAEYMSWSDTSSSPFSSMHGGERRHQHQRQSEAPTLLMPDNASDSFRIPTSSSTSSNKPPGGTGAMPSFLGDERKPPAGSGAMPSFLGEERDALGAMQSSRSGGGVGVNYGKMNERSSLFPASSERKNSLEEGSFNTSGGSSGGASGSYSLFSYSSPWSGSKEGLNLSSSPFSSSPSSPRSQSPSVHHHQQADPLRGLGLGWSPAERSGGSWGNTAPSRGHQLSSSPTSGLLPENLQSIWSSPMSSSEASPLDQLLKNQRQRDHDT